jgi:Lrp/AsnC family leucine-responsive transcriptional regulator
VAPSNRKQRKCFIPQRALSCEMPIQAYVLIRTHPGKARNVAEAISKLTGCRSVCTVTGRYDVIALFEAEDLKGLGDLILQKVHTIGGVERTETAVVV